MPYPTNIIVRPPRRPRRAGLGLILPSDVPSRMRPWTADATVPYPPPALTPGQPTPADLIRAKASQAEQMFKSIAGRSLANPDAAAIDQSRPPWVEPPLGYEPFFWPGIINTPTASGTDQTVTTLFNQSVPQGWDGVIQAVANFYTGPGFVAGAGILTWRIIRNAQPFKTFDSIQVALGTYTQQGGVQPFVLPQPIRIFAGDVIKYIVNHAAPGLSTAGTQIITFLGGYIYPRP